MPDDLPHFGTDAVGYVEGKYGPFKCGRCDFYMKTVGGCVHPEVMADKQVPQENGKMRFAKVEADGCCNEWTPRDE